MHVKLWQIGTKGEHVSSDVGGFQESNGVWGVTNKSEYRLIRLGIPKGHEVSFCLSGMRRAIRSFRA